MATPSNVLTAPNEGLADQLAYILAAPISGVLPWLLMLWTNAELVPDQDTVYADLTEATFQGYSRVTLGRDQWTTPVIEDNAAVSTWTTQPTQWIATGTPETLYGWAIITPVDSVIRYLEPFPAPVTAAPDMPVGVLPRVMLTTLPESSLLKQRRAARKRGVRIKAR